jgi:NAD(P)-dependent dehydrogenase (short-subunit alcohol dehydrogenase family)
MLKAKYGRIVNISSVTGPMVCDPCEVAYSMAKAGVMGFTRSIAVEYASSNITCNAVLPGYILTQMAIETAERTKPGHADEVIKNIESGIPMGRMGTPQDIGYLVAFLASDEASYITGIPVIIDGGNALPETNVVGDL